MCIAHLQAVLICSPPKWWLTIACPLPSAVCSMQIPSVGAMCKHPFGPSVSSGYFGVRRFRVGAGGGAAGAEEDGRFGAKQSDVVPSSQVVTVLTAC